VIEEDGEKLIAEGYLHVARHLHQLTIGWNES
jgi:hypothetical protein